MIDETFFHSLSNLALQEAPYPDPRFPPSPYYRFLRLLAASLYPNLSVELGVCGGGGSLHLARGAPGKRVVGVDIGKEYASQIDWILQNYSNFTFWPGDSVASAPEIYQSFGAVGILFIDTVHTYERTLEEYEAWKPYLDSSHVVCFDDLFRPGMSQAWRELPGPKLRMDELHEQCEDGGGFGVIWRNS